MLVVMWEMQDEEEKFSGRGIEQRIQCYASRIFHLWGKSREKYSWHN